MHFKLCTSGLPHRSRRVRWGPSPSSAVCTGFSMKNRWELSSHLYWWGFLSSPGSSLAVQYLSLRDNTILQRRSTAFCECVCKRHVCMELQRNRQVSKQPPEFPGTKFMKNVFFLMWKHQKTLASSCGHVYIINAHICRCGTREHATEFNHTTNRAVRNLLLESFGIWAALFRRESILCFQDRDL